MEAWGRLQPNLGSDTPPLSHSNSVHVDTEYTNVVRDYFFHIFFFYFQMCQQQSYCNYPLVRVVVEEV